MENTETYRGVEIEIMYDHPAQNPFKDWDGLIPTMVKFDGNWSDYSDGDINDYLANRALSDGQVIYWQERLAQIFEKHMGPSPLAPKSLAPQASFSPRQRRGPHRLALPCNLELAFLDH